MRDEKKEKARFRSIDAFNRASLSYDADFSGTHLGQYNRARVQARLDKLFRPGMLVLDIGCGTGDDAIHLAKRGVHVIACDFSPGMLNQAGEKIRRAGLGRHIELKELGIESLARLVEELPMGFDGLYSNFGPINIIEDLPSFVKITARLLDPGGRALHVVMNRRPFFESIYFLLHGRTYRAFARWKGKAYVTVGGTPIESRFYSPSELIRYFSYYFSVERVEALSLILPPPYLIGHFRRRRNFYRQLIWLDKWLSRLPGPNAFGDHFIIEMRRNEHMLKAAS